MHQLTNLEVVLLCVVVFVACLAFVAGFILGVWACTKDPSKPAQPAFPIKGMHNNYSKIEDQIKACKNKKELRDAYLSIFSFEALYADSASFTSELYEKYDLKQKELSKQKEVLVKVH